MNRKILFAVAILLVGLVYACGDQQPPTTPNIVINNTATNNNGGSADGGSGSAAGCLPSEETPVRVDLSVPDGTIPVGSSAPIDSTPKSPSGKRSDQCNILQGIAWTAVPSTVCFIKAPGDFNTAVACTVAGNCQITATVPGKGAFGTSTVVCK